MGSGVHGSTAGEPNPSPLERSTVQKLLYLLCIGVHMSWGSTKRIWQAPAWQGLVRHLLQQAHCLYGFFAVSTLMWQSAQMSLTLQNSVQLLS